MYMGRDIHISHVLTNIYILTCFYAHEKFKHICLCTHKHSFTCTLSPWILSLYSCVHIFACVQFYTHTPSLSLTCTHTHTYAHTSWPIFHTSFPNFQKVVTGWSGQENKIHLECFYMILMIFRLWFSPFFHCIEPDTLVFYVGSSSRETKH